MAADLYRKLNNSCAQLSYENYLLEHENKQLNEQLIKYKIRYNE